MIRKSMSYAAIYITLTYSRPDPTLLSPEQLPLCEIWKFAYADYLLRMDLLGHRAAILQYSFVGPSTRQEASMGNIDLQPPRRGAGHLETKREGVVCIGCAADRNKHCPSCDRSPIPPTCALCRLPVKGWSATISRQAHSAEADGAGLSMSCGICNHRTHSSCFKKHYSTYTPACPACSCRCLELQGFSYPIIAVPIPPQRALQGSLSPVNVSAVPNKTASHSLADHLRTYGQVGAGSAKGRPGGSGASALGLDTSGLSNDRTNNTTPNPLTGPGTTTTPAGIAQGPGAGDVRASFLSKPLAGVWKGWSGDG